MTAQEIVDRRSYPQRDVTQMAPLDRRALDSLVCLRRSGLTPTDEIFDRVLATALVLARRVRTLEIA